MSRDLLSISMIPELTVLHEGHSFTGVGLGVNRWLRYSRKSRKKLVRIAPGTIGGARTLKQSE